MRAYRGIKNDRDHQGLDPAGLGPDRKLNGNGIDSQKPLTTQFLLTYTCILFIYV